MLMYISHMTHTQEPIKLFGASVYSAVKWGEWSATFSSQMIKITRRKLIEPVGCYTKIYIIIKFEMAPLLTQGKL